MVQGSEEEETVINMIVDTEGGLKEEGQLCNHDFSWKDIKMLANKGPKGLPIATQSFCL